MNRQLATAIWIIDKLALRVGNEKSEEEADTVGCCSLRVEHLSFEDPYTLTMDFLAKDSMRYYQTIRLSKYEGGKAVFKNLKMFCANKSPDEDVFNYLTTSTLNAKLTSYMPKLTAKVFRTFNASVTLEKQLKETYPEGTTIDEMVTQYNDANRQVAILCNHQRSLPKNWEENTAKKKEKLEVMKKRRREEMSGWIVTRMTPLIVMIMVFNTSNTCGNNKGKTSHCSLGDKAIPSIDASSFLLPLGTNTARSERRVETRGKMGIPQVGGIFWKRVERMERRVESLA